MTDSNRPQPGALLVHYGELGLKGGNRPQFERRLFDRLKLTLEWAGIEAAVQVKSERYVVRPRDRSLTERALRALVRVPGVANVSKVFIASHDLDAIREAALMALAGAPSGSFKVESRRAEKSFPLTSIELSQQIGKHIADHTDHPVDVKRPDITVRIHVLKNEAYVSAARIRACGGLPVGSAGKLISFLSGGFDSVVATWLMIRRGAKVIPVHFHNRTHEGEAVLEKLEDACGVLAWSAGRLPLHIVPFEQCQRAIVAAVPPPYRMLVYRRAMFRIAHKVAAYQRSLGYITGDSLGQVASQTTENLQTIQAAARAPVYAPLMGHDKREIIDLAQRIGTYEICARPHNDCCSFLSPPKPATVSYPSELDKIESAIDWEPLVEHAAGNMDVRRIGPDPTVLEQPVANFGA